MALKRKKGIRKRLGRSYPWTAGFHFQLLPSANEMTIWGEINGESIHPTFAKTKWLLVCYIILITQ